MNQIFAVLDDNGEVTYRLYTTTRTTIEYGTILAQLAVHIAEMMQIESEGKIPAMTAHAQIVAAFKATPAEVGDNMPHRPH